VKVLPPPLVSFASVEALIAALPDATRAMHAAEIRRVVALGLPPAVSLRTVATLFGVSAEFVGAMSRASVRYYRVFKIKKGKKTRTIQAPKVGLKLIQAWFGGHVSRAIQLPPSVFGFVPGKSGVKEAASVHCGANWVYSIDLRDFFPSITEQQVRAALVRMGYAENTASFMARLLTLQGRLPQGSPASPVISNVVFTPTDSLLGEFATANDIQYTRYADDLVFSGLGEPPDDLQVRLREIVTVAGWTIADDKEYFARRPARLKVHGLLVHGGKPRLTKGYRNRIRAYRHLLAAGKIAEADQAKILGHLSYADFIDKN
jgi:RNA-directed DNA polymerase